MLDRIYCPCRNVSIGCMAAVQFAFYRLKIDGNAFMGEILHISDKKRQF